MAGAQQFNITLPDDIAQMVKAKVLSGEYADESEVICESLSALKSRDDARYQSTLEGLADFEAGRVVAHEDVKNAFDTWLLEEVAPAYDRLKSSPERTISVDVVRDYLSHKRAINHLKDIIWRDNE